MFKVIGHVFRETGKGQCNKVGQVTFNTRDHALAKSFSQNLDIGGMSDDINVNVDMLAAINTGRRTVWFDCSTPRDLDMMADELRRLASEIRQPVTVKAKVI